MKLLMKIKSSLLMLCFGAAILATYGCSKDEPAPGNCYDGNWAQQYTAELIAWSNAATTYSQEPTLANCTAYKSAGIAYLDALGDIYDCVPSESRADIDKDIEEAKAELNDESCD